MDLKLNFPGENPSELSLIGVKHDQCRGGQSKQINWWMFLSKKEGKIAMGGSEAPNEEEERSVS